MSDVYLGVIAVSVLAMAVMQVTALVFVVLLVRRLIQLVTQVSDDVRPMLADLRSVAADASKAVSLGLAQVERVERLVGDVGTRIEATLALFEEKLLSPVREAMSVLAGIGAALSAFRRGGPKREAREAPAARDEGDEGLFVG